MRGSVVGGADWQILRSDGALELDARYAIKDERGGVVQVLSQGLRHGPPEVMAQLARGFRDRPDVRYGLTALCIGLGMGAAILWENLQNSHG